MLLGRGILALCILLVGCAEHRAGPSDRESPPTRASPPSRAASPNLAGFSPDFKAGYADGCASVSAPLRRDPARFAADDAYARGWRDGYSGCKK